MGELRGHQHQPRDLAGYFYDAGWKDAVRLVEAVAVCLSESQGYDAAYNDNVVPDGETRRGLDGITYTGGQVWQRDCGAMQIAIAASLIGTQAETDLYEIEYNIARARVLFEARVWQPWAAHGKRVYLRDTYVKRASRGVGNFLAGVLLERETDDLDGDGVLYEHSLQQPVLDYTYRVIGMHNALGSTIAKARQLKPIGGPLVDAKADEIIKVAVAGQKFKTA